MSDLLGQLAHVVAGLSGAEFSSPRGDAFFGASVGGHVRHVLDHVRALFEGITVEGTVFEDTPGRCIEYDRRERGTPIEHDPAAALREIERLKELASSIADRSAQSPVRVVALAHADGEPVKLASTLGRELAFVLSHTVHHNAMIRSMLGSGGTSRGESTRADFGFAPATLAHARTREQPCAR